MRRRARTDPCGGDQWWLSLPRQGSLLQQGSDGNRNRTLPKPIPKRQPQTLDFSASVSGNLGLPKRLVFRIFDDTRASRTASWGVARLVFVRPHGGRQVVPPTLGNIAAKTHFSKSVCMRATDSFHRFLASPSRRRLRTKPTSPGLTSIFSG